MCFGGQFSSLNMTIEKGLVGYVSKAENILKF